MNFAELWNQALRYNLTMEEIWSMWYSHRHEIQSSDYISFLLAIAIASVVLKLIEKKGCVDE